MATGLNRWKEKYTDANGKEVFVKSVANVLAYQVTPGGKFELANHAGIFAEAGYGKYIVQGGLYFQF